MKRVTIIDCYTDEPSGLGVPPYIGTYPRYIAGKVMQATGVIPTYLTIDDLRNAESPKKKNPHKTDIRRAHLTSNKNIAKILRETDEAIIIIGVHVPGKYLSAVPGTLKEITSLLKPVQAKKTLAGPALFGTQTMGGKMPERIPATYDSIFPLPTSFNEIDEIAPLGAQIVSQIQGTAIAEIETARGCDRNPGCSFCTEPIKNKFEKRTNQSIIKEIRSLTQSGIKHFRLGKQSCFYSIEDPIGLLREIRRNQDVDILHIDNVNPAKVITREGIEITKAIVTYCSDGNVAAFGAESFDPAVIKANNLNSDPLIVLKAIEILNQHGSRKGSRGQHMFLPGINILFGLIGETKTTHERNMEMFSSILSKGLLLRRINIRKVIPFSGTPLGDTACMKYLKKNGKYYWKWRNQIRQEIDLPLLRKLVPTGTTLRSLDAEVHDGNTTFLRTIGTYPLIVGVKERLTLGASYDIEITGHMLRSATGKVAHTQPLNSNDGNQHTA